MDKESDPPLLIRQIELQPLQTRGQLISVDDALPPPAEPFWRRHMLPLVTFVAPVFAAAVYLFLIASDRYVSEARFVIRSLGSSGYEGVASLIQNEGLSRASGEANAVNEYIMSRAALDKLVSQDGLKEIFARPEADFINRFPNLFSRDEKENLFKYYQRMLNVYIDGGTGISTLEVTAFRPDDAHALALALLRHAEALINRLNDRAHKDALAYANTFVEEAREEMAKAERRLTKYRNSLGMVDPASEAGAAMERIGRLSTELVQIEAMQSQQLALTPASPTIGAFREQIKSYRDQIEQEKLRLAGKDSSMAARLGEYEQLVLEREVAAKALGSAEANREKARQDAEQQHLYLQTIVEPNLPDQPKYPRRYLYFLATIFGSLIVYVIARTLRDIAVEHVQ